MNEMIQPGMHPDADTLTAFAEHLLPTAEREQVLVHMSACGRCREVVFLAQQGAEEEVAAAPASETPASKTRGFWLSGWRWAWVPIGALAAAIGVAVVLHFEHAETAMKMARNVQELDALQSAVSTPATTSTHAEGAKGLEKSKSAAARDKAPVLNENRPLRSAEKKELQQKRAEAEEAELGKAAPPVAREQGIGAGAVHGYVASRALGYGGPVANQLQQNATQQNLQQNQIEPAQNENFADKPESAGAAPGAAMETVTVVPSTPVEAKAAAPAPPARLSDAQSVAAMQLDLSSVATKRRDLLRVVLPDKAKVLSVASGAGRDLAISATGTLYLSEDRGRHWRAIPAQWTGKAVEVRNIKLDAKDAQLKTATPEFELLNDKAQAWKSSDGKTWTPEPEQQK